LRAYRFHSELGFAIEARTRGYLRELAALLPRVAGERLGAELLKLLAPGRAAQTLALMAEDGLLWELLPELQATQGVTQGGYHHRDVWGHTLEVVANLERLLSAKEPPLPANAEAVASYLAAPERPVLLLLAALLHDVAKPACALDDGAGRTRFLGHEVEGGRVAAQVAGRLALRGDLREGLRGLVLGHMRPVLLANSGLAAADRPAQVISIGALRRLFRDAGPDGVGLVLLALADVQGCRGPATQPGYHQAVAGVLDAMLARYRAWQTETAEQPLLTGADLIAAGHAPSPAFGRALRAVDDARADGLVANAAEALAWAQRHLAGDGRGEGEGLPGSEEVF
jgi:poly(A) polymerase